MFITSIITNQTIAKAINQKSFIFLLPFLINVKVIPTNEAKIKNIHPVPILDITSPNEAGFCSATVVKTFGQTVVIPTSFNLIKLIGSKARYLIVLKPLNKLTNITEDSIKVDKAKGLARGRPVAELEFIH